ncbi:pyrroloquinoline quinone precursor peptide PqqA [Methylocystis hirsuta]
MRHISRQSRKSSNTEEKMAWTTPVIVEVCVGMEITSYESAEI